MKAKTPRQIEKEAERGLAAELKKHKRIYGFYVLSSGFLYHKSGEFFCSAIYRAKMSEARELVIELICYVKPYAYDDVFWDITDLQDNKSHNDSLRANGAFTCPSYILPTISLPFIDPEVTAQIVSKVYIEQCDGFLASVQNSIEVFIQQIETIEDIYGINDVLRIIGYVHKGLLDTAVMFAKDRRKEGKSGGYGFGGKSFYEIVVEKYSNIKDQSESGKQRQTNFFCENKWQAVDELGEENQIELSTGVQTSHDKMKLHVAYNGFSDGDGNGEEDYFKDFVFTIENTSFDTEGTCTLACLLSTFPEITGLGITISPKVEGTYSNGAETTLASLVFYSLGDPSDRFVAQLCSAFDIEIPDKCLMAPSIPVAALSLSGNPVNLKDEPVKFKLFYDSSDETYFELFLWIDIANSKVVWSEKDPDYREEIFAVFTGGNW